MATSKAKVPNPWCVNANPTEITEKTCKHTVVFIPVKYYVLPDYGFTPKIKTTAIGEQTIQFSADLSSQFFSLVIFSSFL